MALGLKPKQVEGIEAINDPEVDTLVLLGSVGTGKTVVAAHIIISICKKFADSSYYAWRKNNTVSRKTLIKTYKRTLKSSNFVENEDWWWRDRDMEIRFPNGSVISFTDADRSRDPDQQKIKGIDASGNHIDEANELNYDTFEMISSRKGRNNDNGQPSINIVTMNPNDGWAKKIFYTPWKEGKLPSNVRVLEFGIEDSWQSPKDVAKLKLRSKWWVQRYLYNNWDYADESSSILSSRWFAQNMTDKIDREQKRSSALDVAIKRGGDRAVAALWQGFTLTDIKIVKDHDEETNTDTLTEDFIEYNANNQVGWENAAVDAVGVGAGVIGSGKKRGHNFFEYVSGAKPIETLSLVSNPGDEDWLSTNYDMLRSQAIHAFALAMEQGIVKLWEGCPWLEELQNEAMLHTAEETKTQYKVLSKDKVKEQTGESPDIFDAVIMGFLMQIRRVRRMEWAAPR